MGQAREAEREGGRDGGINIKTERVRTRDTYI